jgi:hypothetical protein
MVLPVEGLVGRGARVACVRVARGHRRIITDSARLPKVSAQKVRPADSRCRRRPTAAPGPRA